MEVGANEHNIYNWNQFIAQKRWRNLRSENKKKNKNYRNLSRRASVNRRRVRAQWMCVHACAQMTFNELSNLNDDDQFGCRFLPYLRGFSGFISIAQHGVHEQRTSKMS